MILFNNDDTECVLHAHGVPLKRREGKSREVGAYRTAQKLSELERIAHLQGAHLIVSPILDSALSRNNTKSDERYLRLVLPRSEAKSSTCLRQPCTLQYRTRSSFEWQEWAENSLRSST